MHRQDKIYRHKRIKAEGEKILEIMDDLFGTAKAAAKVEKIEKGNTASAQAGAENGWPEAKVFADTAKGSHADSVHEKNTDKIYCAAG